jgi:hypothetical protein
VENDGAPRIVYHGTCASFGVFRPKSRNSSLGFHFGTVSQAGFFAGCAWGHRGWSGGNLIPVYLRIEKPLRMPDVFERGWDGVEGVATWLWKNGCLTLDQARSAGRASSAGRAYESLIRAIEAAGYDGIVYENEHEGGTATRNEDAYAVFHPEQIMSVFSTLVIEAGIRTPSRTTRLRLARQQLPQAHAASRADLR